MTTIYQRLSPLGFAEWYAKKQEIGTVIAYDEFEYADKTSVDSSIRTTINALAFRWLREEKGIFFEFGQLPMNTNNKYYFEIEIGNTDKDMVYGTSECYPTYPQVEIAALEKAAEIIESKK